MFWSRFYWVLETNPDTPLRHHLPRRSQGTPLILAKSLSEIQISISKSRSYYTLFYVRSLALNGTSAA